MLSEVQLAKLQMDFVASVSHELRTPLAVICSAADNIADGVVEGKEQLTRYGVVIRNQTRQITELVNEILLFASTKEREVRYHLRQLKVKQIVESVIENTAELARSSGFVIEQREIGRASCREREEMSVDGVELRKNIKKKKT